MKCYECSTKNPDDAPYCRYCGTPFVEEAFPDIEEEQIDDDGPQSAQEVYYEQTKPRRIGLFTRLAYRLLCSPRRYAYAFGIMALFSICFGMLIMLLCGIGPDAQRAFALAGEVSGGRQPIPLREAQQAWQLLWSYLVVLCACAAGLAGTGATAYKMTKILVVFRRRKRTIVPINWDEVDRRKSG